MIPSLWLRQFAQRWSLRGGNRLRHPRRVLTFSRCRVRPILEVLEERCLPTVTITDLGVLPGGATSEATAINDAGQVVGYSNAANGNSQAFLYSKGQMTDLGTLGSGQESQATGINNVGEVVGWSGQTALSGQAFVYSGGTMTGLGTLPGDTYSMATGINSDGEVVGTSVNNNTFTSNAFVYINDQMTNLNNALPANSGWSVSGAAAINDSAQIVGVGENANSNTPGAEEAVVYSNGGITTIAQPAGAAGAFPLAISPTGDVAGWFYADVGGTPQQHAFLYTNGVLTDLGTLPGYTYSYADGINSSDQIVGALDLNEPDQTAMLYSNGQMINLNTLLPASSGWQLTLATAINDRGQIVGQGTINGATHAFLLNLNSVPVVSVNPSSQSVTVGQSATFTASASGSPQPTVQWQVSTDMGMTFSNIEGATNTTLTLNNVTAAMSGYQYQAVFTNIAGNDTTNAAKLTVTSTSPSPSPSPSPPSPPSQPTPPPISAPPLLAFLESILGGGTETVNADGSATITDSIFGFPLLAATFNSSGMLVDVTLFGIDITFLFSSL